LHQNRIWFVFVLLVKFRIVRKCTEVVTKPNTNSSNKKKLPVYYIENKLLSFNGIQIDA